MACVIFNATGHLKTPEWYLVFALVTFSFVFLQIVVAKVFPNRPRLVEAILDAIVALCPWAHRSHQSGQNCRNCREGIQKLKQDEPTD